MAGAASPTGSVEQASLGVAPGVEQPPNVAQWLAVLREGAPAAKKAKAACRLREFSGKQSPGWPESPQGRDVAAALGRYEKSLRRPCSGRFIKEQLAYMQPQVHETNENVKKLVALQEGKADKQLQLKDRQLQLQRARKERADALLDAVGEDDKDLTAEQLAARMEALRTLQVQRQREERGKASAAAALARQEAKEARRAPRPGVVAGAARGGPEPLDAAAPDRICAGHQPGFLSGDFQRELLDFFRERLQNDEPYTVSKAGRRPQKLHHKKLMYGTPDEAGLLPMYNFGLLWADMRRTAPTPPLIQRAAEEVRRCFGVLPKNCVVNVYESGDDYTAHHQDQGFSEGTGRVEAKESVFIIRLGATRPLAFLTLDGDETKRIQLASGDCYELTGPVNACSRHSVPPKPN